MQKKSHIFIMSTCFRMMTHHYHKTCETLLLQVIQFLVFKKKRKDHELNF